MNNTRNRRRTFQIGDVSIHFITRNATLLQLTGNWMSKFEMPMSKITSPTIRFTMIGFKSNERVPFPLPVDANLLYKNHFTQYYAYRDLWIILLQSATVIINRSSNKIVAFAHYNDLRKSKYLEDFMHPLFELLRQNGVYAHHAAAVSKAGQGLLLLGKSGQGKTTLSVDLLSRGFDFLADDRCFLRENEVGWEVLGFYEPIRYYPDNVDHIQEVHKMKNDLTQPVMSNGKAQLDLYPLYSQRIIDCSHVAGLVFPSHSPEEQTSRLEPMTTSEALITLLPLTMVCFDRTTSRSHFDFCVRLTTSLPAVKLVMGQDRERWHELVEQFLSSIPPEHETRDGNHHQQDHCN